MTNLRKKVYKSKQDLRQAVWDFMEEDNLVTFPRPCYGKIPTGKVSEK